MIFSWLFFLTVSIPLDRWAPAYINLNNGRFKYLVGALQEGRILPADEPAEVYSKNPYLWPIHPYKFTYFFERAITLMSTLSDDEYTLILSLPSLASQINPFTQSSLPDTIFGNNREQSTKPESEHEFSQSQPAIPTPAVLASLESVPATMSTKFNVSGRPNAGTPMALISSYLQAHQQMHLPGVLVPLTNGRFQFKIVQLHGMTSKNTYMYPGKSNHKQWFIFYILEKRANSAEAARKLKKGDHNIMPNGKVLYSKFKISKNSELVATTRRGSWPEPQGFNNQLLLHDC